MPSDLLQRPDVTLDWRPPPDRGVIERLVAEEPPGTLALVDGLFHQTLAVGHAELRLALERGWTVWGLASLGAIRACEMAPLGMRGFGRVALMYAEKGLEDDEVALLHTEEPPHQPLTLPMVQIREIVRHLVAERALPAGAAAAILADLKRRWYGERSPELLFTLLADHGLQQERVRALTEPIERFNIKAQDLIGFLRLPAAEMCPAAGDPSRGAVSTATRGARHS
ncbi:TfuA-like protein [Nonomuraea angiospora]|uniref:TfuA-like core domain-containing protein n=1 Tax=Nonomuraea angiospora TaxID=46172 RepID=A0ABR9LNS2_9ACTN|nr:TfuA-like protein [Nonomuraea angiospora]MBE1582306.1 hypothetical protein [Nonomuraea angiospora]